MKKKYSQKKNKDYLKTKTKQIVDYFPRGGSSDNTDFTFNTAIVDKKDRTGEKFLKKKRKLVKDSKPDEDTVGELDQVLEIDGENTNSRALLPKFKIGDLVLLSIAEIRKDYMIANYSRNKKAMIHANYSGLNNLNTKDTDEDFNFQRYFKIGQFVCGAVVSPGNDIQLPAGYMNKKILVSIEPKIINTSLNLNNLIVGMDLYGRLIQTTEGFSADFGFSNIEQEMMDFSEKVANGKKDKFDFSEEIEEVKEMDDIIEEDIEQNENGDLSESEEDFDIQKLAKNNKKRRVEKTEALSDYEIKLIDNEELTEVFSDKISNSYYFFKLINLEIKDQKHVLTVSLNYNKYKFPIKKCEYKFLRPGFLFKANETRELVNGVEVAFGGNIGSIFTDHKSDKTKNVLSRIIHLSINKNAVSLSSRKNIVNFNVEDIDKKRKMIGQTFKDVKVDKALFGHSYQFSINGFACFLHTSQVENREEMKYMNDEVIEKVLVKEYNYFDDRAMLSNKKGLIDQEFITWENIYIGKFVKAIINDVRVDGISLRLNNFIEGRLPRDHLTDFPLTKVPKKFKVGQTIDARIFAFDYSTKYLQFTCKESYMDAKSVLTGDINQLKEGEEINVVFVGNSLFQHSGSLLAKLINFNKLKSKENFKVGKLYTYRVYKITTKGKENRLYLTNETEVWQPGVGDFEHILKRNPLLNTIATVLNFNKDKDQQNDLSAGSVYEFSIVSSKRLVKLLLKLGVEAELISENIETITKHFLVAKNQETSLYGFIPQELVSDFYQDKMMQGLLKSKNETLKVLVLYYNTMSRCIFLTGKKSLVHNTENISLFNNLIDGHIYYGYANKKAKNGFILQFLENEKSIVKSKISFNIIPGQTIVARYKFDEKLNKRRFDCSNVYSSNNFQISELRDEAVENLKNYLDDLTEVMKNKNISASLKINGKIEGKIGMIKEYGVLVSLKGENTSSNITGFLKNEHMKLDSSKYIVGDSKSFRIIDFDLIDNIVYLTDSLQLDKFEHTTSIVDFYNQNKSQPLAMNFVIELFHDNYFSVSLENNPLIKGIMPCNLYNFNYESSQLSDMFKIGDCVSSKIIDYNSTVDKLILDPPVKLLTKISTSSFKDKQKNVIYPGNIIKGRINGIKGTYVYVYIDKNHLGRIHFNHFKGNLDQIREKLETLNNISKENSNLSKNSSELYPEELKIKCKLLHVEKKNEINICDLTNDVETQFSSLITPNEVKELDTTGENSNLGIISKIDILNKYPLKIDFNLNTNKIQIHYSHLPLENITNLKSSYKIGDIISFYTIKNINKSESFNHSLIPFSKIPKKETIKFELDKLYPVRVLKSITGRGLIVDLSAYDNHTEAFVDICEISDDLHPNPLNLYNSGSLLLGRILKYDEKSNKYLLSLRNSVVDEEFFNILKSGSTLKYAKKFDYFEKIADYRNKLYKFSANQVIENNLVAIGYITASSEKGVFIKLSSDVIVRASLRELTDEKATKPYLLFKQNSLVVCRIISIYKPEGDSDKMNINVSLRESVVKYNLTLRTKDLNINNFYLCSIMNESDNKYEVCIIGSTFTGLIKKKKLNEKNSNEIKKALDYKFNITLQLIKLDKNISPPKLRFSNSNVENIDSSIVINSLSKEQEEKNKIYSELFENIKTINEKYKDDEINNELKELEKNVDKIDYEGLLKNQTAEEDENINDEDEVDDDLGNEIENGELDDSIEENGEEIIIDHNIKSQFLKGLGINLHQGMDIENDIKENQLEQVDTSTKNLKSSKKREKDHLKEEIITREKEKNISSTKMDDTQSVEYYEKQILSDPNNSVYWIQYAAYILDKLNLQSAKKIFERAITTINIAMAKEKLNIWIAYMNLENTYGNQESFKNVVERALEVNDKKTVYKHLVSIYKHSRKYDLAYEVYKILIKNFFSDFSIWKNYLEFLFEVENIKLGLEDIVMKNKFSTLFIVPKEGLNRSLQVLNKNKHVEVLIHYGQLQYKYEFTEEARNTFESILKNYPKRTDIWIVYIDKEIKHTKNVDKIRSIFEKLLQVDLKIKNLKNIIKKYLEFEKEFGNVKSLEYVKNLTQKLIVDKMSEIRDEPENEDGMEVDDQ